MGTKTLPVLELTCKRCEHRWPTRGAAGASIRCPQCRHVRRVPADRPRTEAAARAGAPAAGNGEAGRLAALWAAERPAASWRDDLEGGAGDDCPDCGEPMQWAGAHTVLICPARHDDGRARRFASPGAIEREEQYAAELADAEQPDGPSSAELARVSEDREVSLDCLARMREQLARIPRGDDWREDAIRGLHKLGKLEKRCQAARSAAELADADDAAGELEGELDGVLRHADRLARQQARKERGGGFLRFRRGADGEYEMDSEDDYPDADDGEGILAQAPAIPGYVPPDPAWRQRIPSGQWLPHWRQPDAGDPWARYDRTAAEAARARGHADFTPAAPANGIQR